MINWLYYTLFTQHQIIDLLEKSRVVNQNEDNRNFHIFYQIFSSCNEEKRRTLGLNKNAADYRFLNQDSCVNVDGIDDSKNALITEVRLSLY